MIYQILQLVNNTYSSEYVFHIFLSANEAAMLSLVSGWDGAARS